MISKTPNEAIGPVGFRRRECTTCAAHFIKCLGGITAISQRGFKRALPLREQRQLASPTPFSENRVMSMYRFTWMGHDQCVATALREHITCAGKHPAIWDPNQINFQQDRRSMSFGIHVYLMCAGKRPAIWDPNQINIQQERRSTSSD